MDATAFFKLTYGLYIVCALDAEGRKVGCIANTFSQVTNDPIRASITLNKDCVTCKAVEETGKFTVSVLTVDATMDLIGRFGFNSSYNIDKFAGTPHELDESGIPYITGPAIDAHFSVDVDQTVDVGTHLLMVGLATEAEATSNVEPLTYAYYHNVLKGKTPPKAVSYIEDELAEKAFEEAESVVAAEAAAIEVAEAEGALAANAVEAAIEGEAAAAGASPKVVWRCTLCGYVEERYPDGLPDDYTCPWCGAGREMFERVEL